MKVAVIGGAGAIGGAVCTRLDHAGHEPISVDVMSGADQPMDVRDPWEVAQVMEDLQPLDGLVYAAGMQVARPLAETDVEMWNDLFDVNVRGAYLAVNAAMPLESIVLVASIAALTNGGPGLTAYAASKGALVSLGRSLAVELAPDTRVNVVAPGWTDTSFNDPVVDMLGGRRTLDRLVLETVPLRRQGDPSEVARAVVFALTCTYMTGSTIVVDGGRTVS